MPQPDALFFWPLNPWNFSSQCPTQVQPRSLPTGSQRASCPRVAPCVLRHRPSVPRRSASRWHPYDEEEGRARHVPGLAPRDLPLTSLFFAPRLRWRPRPFSRPKALRSSSQADRREPVSHQKGPGGMSYWTPCPLYEAEACCVLLLTVTTDQRACDVWRAAILLATVLQYSTSSNVLRFDFSSLQNSGHQNIIGIFIGFIYLFLA